MPRADRRIAALVLVAVLLLLAWWSMRPPEPPDSEGPSPMDAWRARRSPAPPPDQAAPDGVDEPAPDGDPEERWVPSTVVVVHLRPADQGFLMFPRHARLDPGEFWPLDGEAPFPDGGTAPGLQDLIARSAEAGAPEELAWLDLAWEEGLDPDTVSTDDPWTAVLALEIARRGARSDQAVAYRDALDAGEGPENGRITPDALVGPPDVDLQLDLADEVAERWPDHPAGEFARLYALDAVVTGKIEEGGRQIALDILRDTDDALVVGQAIGLLTTQTRGDVLEGSDLDRLEAFATDFPELVDPLDLATFALDQAMAVEDGPRTRAWLDRLDRAVNRECTEVDPDLRTSRCLIHRDNLDQAVAYVGDIAPSQADTWRQAFEIAGYHCARLGHDWQVAPIRALAHWKDGWSWEPWDRPSGTFGGCFREAATSGPSPPEAVLDVRVAVVR